jgi:hypothetical protein
VAPWVPAGLAQVVDATLVHEWAQRLPDAHTLLRALSDATQIEAAGSGRYSAVSVPQYQTGQMAVYQKPAAPVALDATMPMSGEHEALIAAARAQASASHQAQHAGTQLVTGPHRPISTETAVLLAPSASNPAISVDDAPAAGVPQRSGTAIMFIGLAALVVALGVGGFFVFGNKGGDAQPASSNGKPVETAAVVKEPEGKTDKTEKTAKPEEKKADPAPTVTATATTPSTPKTVAPPAFPKGKLPPPPTAGKSSAAPSVSAPPPPAAPVASGKSTGSGFGGAGVSESY